MKERYLWVLVSDQSSFASCSLYERTAFLLRCFFCWHGESQAISKNALRYIVWVSNFVGVASTTDFDHSSHHFLIQILLHKTSKRAIWSLSPAVAVLFLSEFFLLLIWGFDFQIIKDFLFYLWFVPGQYLAYFSTAVFFPHREHEAERNEHTLF